MNILRLHRATKLLFCIQFASKILHQASSDLQFLYSVLQQLLQVLGVD